MIDKLAQSACGLPAVALLAALFVTSCTTPLPPRREAQPEAGGVARTPPAISAITSTATLTSTAQSTAVQTVTPAAAVTRTGTTLARTPAQTATAPATEATLILTLPITATITGIGTPTVTSTPVVARITPTRTALTDTATPTPSTVVVIVASSTPRPTATSAATGATLTPSPTAPAATLTATPSTTPTPTPKPFVTGVVTQVVPATPTALAQEAAATATPASTATALVQEATATATPSSTATAFAEAATPTATPSATPVPPTPTATETTPAATLVPRRPVTYATGDVLKNGDFQGGFDASGVATSWHGFGLVSGIFGWSDETYPALLFQSQHAQMMRIRSAQYPDAYIGVYQTVSVVKGRPYQLTLHGLIRSTEGSPQRSSWGYRLQWGVDPKGGSNWQAVQEWIDLGWDDQPISAARPTIDAYEATITPVGNALTLFVRGWRKWMIPTSEGEFIVDAAHLTGPIPPTATTVHLPRTGEEQTQGRLR